MMVSEWLNTKPYPSSASVEQLLNEKRDRMLIDDHLVTDDEIPLLREYLAKALSEFNTNDHLMVDTFQSGFTLPSELFP